MQPVSTRSPRDVARTAGRGVLYITLAKLFFIVAGYAVHFALPRLLGAKSLYGIYGLVSSVVNVLNMVVIQGVLQSVSKLVSEDEARMPSIRRAALKMQIWVGGGLAVAMLAGADLIAWVQRDPELALYYRLSTAIFFFYGFYAVFIGVLNGQRRFRTQALFDMSYATLKTGFILAAAAAGFSILGVFAGFALASMLVFLAAVWVVGARGGERSLDLEARVRAFMVPIMVYTLVLNLLLTVDLWVLKALVTGQADTLFGAATAGAEWATSVAGDYTAAQVIARIPYQATLSVTFVVFPLISRSTFEGDQGATRGYIRVTLRYSLIILAGMVAVIASAADEVVVLPYPETYRTAADALRVLAPAMLFFALFSIVASIIAGAGHATLVLWLALGTLVVDVALCFLLVPPLGMMGAAAATAVALFAGLVASLAALWRRFKAGVPARSVVRVLAACAATATVSYLVPSPSKPVTLAKCIALAAIYFIALLATGELGAEDGRRLRNVFSRRAAAKEAP
jgi:stage V sporulation protein B